MKIGIIGGTGFYSLFDNMEEQMISTDFGEIAVYKSLFEDNEIYFLPRHGIGHSSLANEINYRGNMMTFKKLGINKVLAVSAVASINPEIEVGALCLLDNFVDWTKRISTYGKYSVDVTDPFCPHLQETFIQGAENLGEALQRNVSYICWEGPRYETRAEIELFAKWGMDLVGMTNATEACLARELGICYSAITHTTNLAAGINNQKLTLEAHKESGKRNMEKVKALLIETLKVVTKNDECGCDEAYKKAVPVNK